MGHLPIAAIRIDKPIHSDLLELHILAARSHDGSTDIVHPPQWVFQHVPAGDRADIGPAIQLSHESAQVLLQALWDAGIRPDTHGEEVKTNQTLLSAKDEHINDLRRIVFKGEDHPVFAKKPDAPVTTPEAKSW